MSSINKLTEWLLFGNTSAQLNTENSSTKQAETETSGLRRIYL